jgi:hypothetical protein
MTAQTTHSTPPRPALHTLNEALSALREFPNRPEIFVDYRSIPESLKKLEEHGFDTREHKNQITPELMTAVVRTTFATYFGKLETALHDFAKAGFGEQTRLANSTPNILAHISSLEGLAARFDVKVSDLYPQGYDSQVKQFGDLLDRREHAYGMGHIVSPLIPLMMIAFGPKDISALSMPPRDL